MKSKFLKFAVLACSLAFMNCEDTTSATDLGDPTALSSGLEQLISSDSNFPIGNLNSSSSTEFPSFVNPESSANISSSPSTDPVSSAVVDPSLTPSTDPVSSAVVDPSSTPSLDPESSSANPVSSSIVNDTPVTVSSSSQVQEVQSSSSVSDQNSVAKKIYLASETAEEKDGEKVEYKTGTGPDGQSILSYPSQLSNDQKHAIVVWGPGGGTQPSAYEGIIRRLASHGFVVIALRESPGDGHLAKEALDWLAKENQNPSSPLNGKLDMNTVGCSGHSMGGLESEQAVIKDERVLTAFMNNSGDFSGSGANKVSTDKSIAILFGEAGFERDNAKNDYNNQGVRAPACLIEMTGGPNNGEGGYGHGSGSWDGMAATVAWMRWHLGGEDFRKADFVGQSGKYIDQNIIGKQGKWKGQCKNF